MNASGFFYQDHLNTINKGINRVMVVLVILLHLLVKICSVIKLKKIRPGISIIYQPDQLEIPDLNVSRNRNVLGIGPSILVAVVFLFGFANNFFSRTLQLFFLLPVQLTLTAVVLPAVVVATNRKMSREFFNINPVFRKLVPGRCWPPGKIQPVPESGRLQN